MNNTEKNGRSVKALFAAIVVLVVLVFGGLYFVVNAQVKSLSQKPFVVSMAKLYDLPAMSINGMKVSYVDYVVDLQTLGTFFESQGLREAYSDEDLSNMTVSRLLAGKLVNQVGDELGVEVTQKDIDARINEMVESFGSREKAEEEILASYGRSLDEFVERVLIPVLHEEKVREAFELSGSDDGADTVSEIRASHILLIVEEETEDTLVKNRATDLIKRINAGEAFADLAQEFGQDGTSTVGGDLGFFGRGAMVPAFEEAAFALEVGELAAEPVKTEFGYHVVQKTEERTKRDFAAYMDGLFREADIEFFVPVNNPFVGLEEDVVEEVQVEDSVDEEPEAEVTQ